MKCDNCKNRDFYGCCGFPLPHACDSCPCRGCDMCRDEQRVVAIYTEKIRRIEAAVGFTLERWQQLYILNQGKVKFMDLLEWARGNHDRMIALRRAYALRYCLYQRQVNGRMLPKEALEQCLEGKDFSIDPAGNNHNYYLYLKRAASRAGLIA